MWWWWWWWCDVFSEEGSRPPCMFSACRHFSYTAKPHRDIQEWGGGKRETATKKLWVVHSSFGIFFDEVVQVLLLHVLIVDGFEKSQRSEWETLEVNWEITHFLMPVWMNDKSCFHMYIVDWYWFKSCLYLHEVAYNSQTRPWVYPYISKWCNGWSCPQGIP